MQRYTVYFIWKLKINCVKLHFVGYILEYSCADFPLDYVTG
jgi:hypothetical protein